MLNSTPTEILESTKRLATSVANVTTPLNPEVCGYVGIVIKPARGAFVKLLKELNIGDRGVYGGYEVSIGSFIDFDTQSVEKKVAAANKVAKLFQAHGIKCRVREYML